VAFTDDVTGDRTCGTTYNSANRGATANNGAEYGSTAGAMAPPLKVVCCVRVIPEQPDMATIAKRAKTSVMRFIRCILICTLVFKVIS